jgi:hypothetical protein
MVDAGGYGKSADCLAEEPGDGSLECLDFQFDEGHDLPFGSTFKNV